MSNKDNCNNVLDENNVRIRAMQAVQKASPALQQIGIISQSVNNAMISAVQSKTMKSVLVIGSRIAEKIATVDFKPILNNISKATISFRYIDLLQNLKWPIFLIQDEMLRERILKVCSENEDLQAVNDIIFEYCSDDFLKAMEEDWTNCSIIAAERKIILSEAMLMHRKEFYYASTSMLMCQLYGIASDIVDFAKRNGLELNDDTKDFVSDFFEIKREDVDKEKGRLLQMIAMAENGPLLWYVIAKYLKEEILCSSDSKHRWSTQPLRNKICHGDQLNFGTKEHSLKAILTIDILIQLAYEISHICRV